MKKLYLLLAAALTASLAAASAPPVYADSFFMDGIVYDVGDVYRLGAPDELAKVVYTANDEYIVYDTEYDAQAAVGLYMSPSSDMAASGFPYMTATVINGNILEEQFSDRYGNCVTFRMMRGTCDISGGDMSEFTASRPTSVNSANVTLYGSSGGWYTAVVTRDGYSWSVTSTFPLATDEIENYVSLIC